MPEMGRSAGKAISEFRKGAKEMTDGFREEVNQPGVKQAANQTIQTPLASIPVAQALATSNASDVFKTPIAAPTGRFCIQCGTSNPPEARFCGSCGTKLPELIA